MNQINARALELERQRREAAERILATHRRTSDAAAACNVTITEDGPHFDLVRVEYADGETREFRRCRPLEPLPNAAS